MKAKLIKVLEHYHLYDGDKAIATTIVGNPMLLPNLSLKNCQAIERGYDLDELVKSKYPNFYNEDYEYDVEAEMLRDEYKSRGFKEGFQKAVEILGDKKFSEENMLKAFITGVFTDETSDHDFEFTELMKDLQQTEWDCIVEMEYYDPLPPTRQTALRPKLDADGCLILKRK